MRKSILNLRKLKNKAILKKFSGDNLLSLDKYIAEFTQNTLKQKSRYRW